MKTFVIGDIHGCGNTFNALIEKLSLRKEDRLILLGDYINKGPRSKGVLDLLIHLSLQGYDIVAIRGNHDQKLIDVVKGNVADRWKTDPNLIPTIKSFNVDSPFNIPDDYLEFLASTPFFIETENYYFVHAGFNFHTKDPLMDKPAMLNIKGYSVDRVRLKGKRIIYGHIPRPISKIVEDITNLPDKIGLDSGCVYYKTQDMGELLALEINSMEIFRQKNIDQPYEGGQYKK